MNHNLEKTLWLGVVLQAAGLIMDAALRFAGGVAVVQVTLPVTAAGMLVCLVGAWRERLAQRVREEQREQAAAVSGETHSLFATEPDTDTPFSAAHQVRQFERFVIPTIPFVLAAICGGGAVWLMNAARTPYGLPPTGALAAGFLAGRAFVVFLLHRLLLAVSHQPEGKPARASAIWLGLTALAASFSAAIVLTDAWAGTTLAGPALLAGGTVTALLAAEAFLMGIARFYKSRSERIFLPASRLGALLCDPSAWAHSLAGALDYQFGFRISDTVAYRTARGLLLPLLIAQVLLLGLSHCLVILEPHEAAVVEFMGRPVPERVLASGYHLVLPPPLQRVRRYPVNRIETLQIGFEHPDDHDHGHHRNDGILLWSEEHHHDEHDFLVAARDIDDVRDLFLPEDGQVPVNLLSISLSMNVQVTNLMHYLTAYRDPRKIIRQTAARHLMLEAVHADVFDLMGPGQLAFARRIKNILEQTIDELNLGLAIRSVDLLGIHPPVAVADAYEAVIGADEMYETAILEGNAYRIRRLPAARAEAYERRQTAVADRDARMTTASAEAELFLERANAANLAPKVYPMRAFLNVLEDRFPRTTRYLIVAPSDADVIEMDFTERPYADLLDAAGRLGSED